MLVFLVSARCTVAALCAFCNCRLSLAVTGGVTGVSAYQCVTLRGSGTKRDRAFSDLCDALISSPVASAFYVRQLKITDYSPV